MSIQVLGCNHLTPLAVRERLAISTARLPAALAQFRDRFPDSEGVLLSTCNRTEIYSAGAEAPTLDELLVFIAELGGVSATEFRHELFFMTGREAVRHLFSVAASLDSMVLGESQILRQVKDAYQVAVQDQSAGQITHAAFQSAIRVAKRITRETTLHQHRISVASVAVHDFALRIFEDLSDKSILVIGAGTPRWRPCGPSAITGRRKSPSSIGPGRRAQPIATEFGGRAYEWDQLQTLLVECDLVISTTGADQYLFSQQQFHEISQLRYQRPLMILDLAVPRDFDPKIEHCLGVYLYSLDDLQRLCNLHREKREHELPRAWNIIEMETTRFMKEIRMDSAKDTIRKLKQNADQVKNLELQRLLNRIPHVDQETRLAIENSFHRLTNKLLHPPLESLRQESHADSHPGLIEALRRLFQIR